MQTWIIGLVLLGIVLPLISSQDLNDEELVFEVKGFRVPSGISLESYDDDDNETKKDEEPNPEIEVDGAIAEGAQDPAAVLVKDTDLDGSAGILIIQNGVQPNTPLLFELRPVATDQKGQYFEVVEDGSPDKLDEGDLEDEEEYEESDLEDYEEPVSAIRRRRPSTKRKRRPVKPNQNPKRRPVNPNPRPNRQPNRNANRRPVATRPKPNRRRNQIPNQNNKRKRINNRITGSPGTRRTQSNSMSQNSNNKVNRNSNKNRVVAGNINQGSGVNTVSNTVTTTETGTANDVPDVNYIVINKPSRPPPPTTERPFWGLLGRDAKDIGTPRSGVRVSRKFNK